MKKDYFELTKEKRKEIYKELKETSYYKQFALSFPIVVIFGVLSIIIFLFMLFSNMPSNFLYFSLIIGLVSLLFTFLVVGYLFEQDKEELMYQYYEEKYNKEEK